MSTWIDHALARLTEQTSWTYAAAAVCASEPTACAALSLLAHGKLEAAQRPLNWLGEHQSEDGSVGVTETDATPAWPTSLAVMAWNAADRASQSQEYKANIERGVAWLLQSVGTTSERVSFVGHDTTLIGWPWVVGTHSWVEPTTFALLALEGAGHGDHPRVQEGHHLLIDRLLPHGGCNYGNTVVFAQELLAHIQTSGIALLGIKPTETDPRVELTLNYLERAIDRHTTSASLGWALLGLAAHGRRPATANALLAARYADLEQRGLNAYHLALLTWAAKESLA